MLRNANQSHFSYAICNAQECVMLRNIISGNSVRIYVRGYTLAYWGTAKLQSGRNGKATAPQRL